MGGTKRGKVRGSLLPHLDPWEARETLRRLLALHPNLGLEAENIARSVLGEVTFESVADEVESVLKPFDIEDLNARAGSGEFCYVDPIEAAWEILNERLEPFLADIERRVRLGLEDGALAVCQGVVFGLYRLEHERRSEIEQWAPDFAVEAAERTVRAWRNGSRTGKSGKKAGRRVRLGLSEDFVHNFVPEWEEMLARLTARGR